MNRETALHLLAKYSAADASWEAHCVQVGAAARHLAELMSRRGHTVDVDRAEVLGLIHDLGRSQGHGLRHGIEGYLLATSEGHEGEARICLLHVLKGRTLEEGTKLGMLSEGERADLEAGGWDFHHLSREEELAILADALMSDTGLVPIEEKYANARRRYGAQPHHYQDEAWVVRLTARISGLLGMTPYDALGETNDGLL
jgi:hypothetical protein